MPACLVLPGIGGLAVQGVLFSCCVGIFAIKLRKEEQKLGDAARSRAEFFLDASKQFAGAAWIHVMNLGFASGANAMMPGGDECEWYWINIMVDTTLGTVVSYFLLQIANAFIRKRLSPTAAEDFKSGEYKSEDGQIQSSRYVKQLVVWLSIVSCMKICMVLLMFLFSGPLLFIAGAILAPFLSQPWLKLLVVMIVFPLIMDGFQIWMIDNFIKRKETYPMQGESYDPEMHPAHVEAAADALLAFSQRCEEATEEALLSLRVRCDEALHVHMGEDMSTMPQKHGSQTSANFDTQYKFQTIVPPDQVVDSD
jgi:hypothetical protein